MNLEDNKKTVCALFDYLEQGDVEAGFALLTEDATWWFPSDEPGGMTLSKQQMRQAVDDFGRALKIMPAMVRGRLTAEGNRVCLEQHSRGGQSHGGASYGNDYHMLVELRDGKICEVREYMNPLLARVLTAEMQAPDA